VTGAAECREPELRQAKGHFQGRFRAMASPCELLIDTTDRDLAHQLLKLVAAEAWRIEDKFSRYRAGNIVAQINESDGRPIEVDEETANMLDFAATLFELSGGRFDITSGALRKVWTFDGSARVPSKDGIATVLKTIGWQRVSWRRPELRLQPGMQIDFGGVGKEYAVDKAAGLAMRMTTRPFLLNFGGDLVAAGDIRPPDGWQVGIEKPGADGASAQKLIQLKTGALATSGDSRRFLLKNGVRYGHILDPRSGWPVEHAPRSVTVAAGTCTQAGMLATFAMLLGADAEDFLDKEKVQYWCLR
jgi:thiamine biosynthesis lipoprotein